MSASVSDTLLQNRGGLMRSSINVQMKRCIQRRRTERTGCGDIRNKPQAAFSIKWTVRIDRKRQIM